MEPAAAGGRKPPPPATPPASDVTTAAFATMPNGPPTRPAQGPSYRAVVAVTAGLMVAAGLGGGALLTWWAFAFRRANAMLWMVPVGLVLLGTSVVAWLSVLASGPTPPSPPDLGA